MTTLDTLAISIPSLIGIIGLIYTVLNYNLKKKAIEQSHTKEDVNKVKEEEERQKQNEIQLASISKDVQYIRLTIDKLDKKYDDHEHRIHRLEVHCKKGGKK